jgi:PAS domain S-box-containing protein
MLSDSNGKNLDMSVEMNKRILFVNNDKDILADLDSHFAKHFEIETALGADAALELLERCAPYAVVVSDLDMGPKGGAEFFHKVRKTAADSICVAITSCSNLEIAAKVLNEQDIFQFLTKPYSPQDLAEKFNEALEQYKRVMTMSSYTYTTYVEDSKAVRTTRSPGCLAVTGYRNADFVGDHFLWLSMIDPEHRSMVKGEFDRIIAGQEVGPIEFKIHKRDGSIRWVRDTIIPHCNKDALVCRYDGMVEDITERKAMEEALRQSEARYERMVDNVPGLVYQCVLRADGKIEFLFVSDSCRELFGLEPEDIKNDSTVLLNGFRQQDQQEFYRLMRQSAERLSPCEWSGCGTFGGELKWFQGLCRSEKTNNGDTLLDGLLLDVTEQKSMSREVELLAKFTNESPNPVLRVSDDGVIIYANKASKALLSFWDSAVGKALPDKLYNVAAEVRTSGQNNFVEVRCDDHIFSILFVSIAGADYVNLYARDITEVKLAEIELRKANDVLREHDRLKNEFVSTVSHELRTPLCIFKNIVSNAMAGVMGKVSHKLYESLRIADRSVDRLSRIVTDFLDISKIESGAMKLNREVVSLKAIVTEVLNSLQALAETKGIELKISNGGNRQFHVSADRDRMVQVLTNLVGNAIKFIPINSHIDVNISEIDDEIKVMVQDDGPGLSKDEVEKIFDRFVQIHPLLGPGEHGTGLGLAITKELIEMHRGRIWAESEPGEGCCFIFVLPKHDPQAENGPDSKEMVITNESWQYP